MVLQAWVVSAGPFLAMITVEALTTGATIITKAALTHGMSNLVFNVYADLLAATIILPLAIFRRKGTPISLLLLGKFFLLSLIGSMAQVCAITGLKYSSPTLEGAIGNLIPLIAYFLAIMTRMEKLDLTSSAGLAVSLGAMVSVLGASIATLCRGPTILMSSYPFTDYHDLHLQPLNWAFGGLLYALTAVLVAVWFIFMTALVREFPEKETIVFFYSFFCTIITGIYSLFMETNPNAWKLRADIELIAILFTALVGETIRNVVHAWCLKNKGVTFTVMFRPLEIVLSVVMAVVFLGEKLHTGSLVGGIVVTMGFYSVMWGKGKAQGISSKYGVDVAESESKSGKAPLLLNNLQDDI